MMDERARAESAWRLHDLGLVVLPVHYPVHGHCSCRAAWACGSPAKHPASSWKAVRLQTDQDLLAMLGAYPRHNLGVSLAPSNLVVLDVDPTEGGCQALAEFEERRGQQLPPTLRVVTASGGWHLYYRLPEDVQVRGDTHRLLHGVTVKGRGGMVVAPPSRGMSEHTYAFDPSSPALPAILPVDVVERVQLPAPSTRERRRQVPHRTLHVPGWAERRAVR